jgi:hypothetical protein
MTTYVFITVTWDICIYKHNKQTKQDKASMNEKCILDNGNTCKDEGVCEREKGGGKREREAERNGVNRLAKVTWITEPQTRQQGITQIAPFEATTVQHNKSG